MEEIKTTLSRGADGSLKLRHVVEITVAEGMSLLEAEASMEAALMKVGASFVEEFLLACDADGSPQQFDGVAMTAKTQKELLVVESSFGAVSLYRSAYQSSKGGRCYYPLDRKMNLIGSATPKFARSIGFKSAHAPAAKVSQDLRENHGRSVSTHFVQSVTELLGELAIAAQPEPDTRLLPPPSQVALVVVGIDGACLQITTAPEKPDAADVPADAPPHDRRKHRHLEWRTAMVGTIALYDKEGERLGTIYTGCAPPEVSGDGKEDFWFLMERDLASIKKKYTKAKYAGISDGARDYVPWLSTHTDVLTLDFYHATGYLSGAAAAMVESGSGQKKRAGEWLKAACHALKHEDGAATRLHGEMTARQTPGGLSAQAGEHLRKAVTYFGNNLERMDYAARRRENQPIASGVTESACGLIIKDRMCGRGMRWSLRMAQHIMTLRCMISTTAECWQNFWRKEYGAPLSMSAVRLT